MQSRIFNYFDEEVELEGFLVTHSGPARPGVIISHAWGGVSAFETEKAEAAANLGYNVLAIDVYGKGIRGKPGADNGHLMAPFLENRTLLRKRMLASFNTFSALPEVIDTKVAAMGYCFGGLCVLDLARSGADVKGVVSIHGLFTQPENLKNEMIKAKVLALHGFEDPLAPPDTMLALAKEMTDASVDWQIHNYGMTYHSFTNPAAKNPEAGSVYNPTAAARAEKTIANFFEEIFE